MDSNPILYLSPAKEMKCSFFDPVQLLMIGWAGRWTQTPSTTPLQPKQWNAHFCITFNIWCWPDWSMDLNLIQHSSPAKKWNAHFWITFNFWRLAGLVDGLKPHPPPISSQKNEILIFVLCWSPGNQPGWLMDSNPICYPSAAKKMKCSFLDFVQILMIGWAGWWTRTPSTTPLHPKKWNAHFGLCSTSDDQPGCSMDSNPSSTSLLPKNEMLIFGLRSTSDDWLGWLMDSNPIHHPSPPKKNEMLIFGLHTTCDVGQTGQWTWTSSTTPLHPKKWNGHFGLCSTSDDWSGWSMDWNSLCHPSPANNMKCYFLDYVQLLMIGWAGQWTQTPSTTPLQPKQWNAHFCITFNIWCWSDWSMDLNLIHHPSAPKKMKCSFWIMFNFWWSAGLLYGLKPIFHLSPAKKWNAYFWITFNFWWSAGLLDGLEPNPPPISSLKIEMLIFWLCSTSDDRLCWSMDSNPSHHCSPAKK